MSALTLRDYQHETVGAVEGAWMRGVQRPAVVLPTGAGKTVVFAEIAKRWVEQNRLSSKQRVIVLAHREELIEQAAAKIRSMAGPDVRVGVVKAERDNYSADIVVASVQTLAAGKAESSLRRRQRIAHVGLVIVDEAHHGVADTYRKVLEHYGCFAEGGARALGVTATMSRTDELALGDVWQEVVYTKDIMWMRNRGYLCGVRGKLLKIDDLDLAKVRKSGGDFQNGALGRALEESLAPEAVARSYAEHSADRQGILFAPTVHCAQVYGEALAAQGFKSELVHGAMGGGLRRDVLERYRQGDVQVLVNCMVLTEGTDLPMTSTIVVGRPTKSQGLFVQMVGRGLRLWPGKEDCLVLIVAGKAAKHSLNTSIELFGEELADLSELEEEERQELADEIVFELEGESEGGTPELPEFVDGKVKAVDLDLFHASKSAWQQTNAGIWFLPAGDRFIVIWPQGGGLWGVAWCHKFSTASGGIAQDVADMGYAMAFAEANVSLDEQMTAAKDRRWRKAPPSQKMKDFARSLAVMVLPGTTGGEVSRGITQVLASRRIDPYVPGWGK